MFIFLMIRIYSLGKIYIKLLSLSAVGVTDHSCFDNVNVHHLMNWLIVGKASMVETVMRTGNLPLTLTLSQTTGVLGVE